MKKNHFIILILCIFFVSCASNKNLVTLPEWANLSVQEDLNQDYVELKWLDENGQETDTAEYSEEGVKLHFEAYAENFSDGEEVFVFIYRNNAKDKDDFIQKISCIVKDKKISGETIIIETNDFLESLLENDKLAYFFAVDSKISKLLEIDFIFKIFILNSPYEDFEHQFYILEDETGGKKYSQKKYIDDDKIILDETKFYLKFTGVKPELTYQIKYTCFIIYNNLSFTELFEE